MIQGCVIRDARSNGINAGDFSNVMIGGSTIEDNWDSTYPSDTRSTGIAADGHAVVGVSAWWPVEPVIIQGNGTGIRASSGAVINVGNATIWNPHGGAVVADSGGLVNLGTWGGGAPVIGGGNHGDRAVLAVNGGEVWVIAPTKIRENQSDGAGASMGGRLIVCCGDDTSISDNQGFGLSAWSGGGLYFWGSALVEGNVRGGVSLGSAEGNPIRES